MSGGMAQHIDIQQLPLNMLQLLATLAVKNQAQDKKEVVPLVPKPIVIPPQVDDVKSAAKQAAIAEARQKKQYEGYTAIANFHNKVQQWVDTGKETEEFPRLSCPFSSPVTPQDSKSKSGRGRGRPKLAYTPFFDWNQMEYMGHAVVQPIARQAKQAAQLQRFIQTMGLVDSYLKFLENEEQKTANLELQPEVKEEKEEKRQDIQKKLRKRTAAEAHTDEFVPDAKRRQVVG